MFMRAKILAVRPTKRTKVGNFHMLVAFERQDKYGPRGYFIGKVNGDEVKGLEHEEGNEVLLNIKCGDIVKIEGFISLCYMEDQQ